MRTEEPHSQIPELSTTPGGGSVTDQEHGKTDVG